MGRTRHSKTGLMLVEDPRMTLKTLCTFADAEVDWSSFKLAYEAEVGRVDNPIDEKHADTHFYTLTTYGLLIPTSERKGKYRLSLFAKNLCASLADPRRRIEYQKMLANLVLTNEYKGQIFKDFIQFVEVKRSREEIYKKFRPIPARTLIAWSEEAGLIATYQDRVGAITRYEKKPTQEQFWNTFVDTYKEMRQTGIFGIKRIYIPIGELRFNVRTKLGLEKSEFDKELRSLLSTKKGRSIFFYGAPTDVFEEQETFEYSGKLYVYLSIKV